MSISDINSLKELNSLLKKGVVSYSSWYGRYIEYKGHYYTYAEISERLRDIVKQNFDFDSTQSRPLLASPTEYLLNMHRYKKVLNKLTALMKRHQHPSFRNWWDQKNMARTAEIIQELKARHDFVELKPEHVREIKRNRQALSTIRTYHGTNCNTLMMMLWRNCGLVSFGQLEESGIPTLSGECDRGICPQGVNRKGTSWTFSARTAIDYSQRTFNQKDPFQAAKKNIDMHLSSSEKGWSQMVLGDWEGYLINLRISVRQLRAYDEKLFQSQYKERLTQYLEVSLKQFAQRKSENETYYKAPFAEFISQELPKLLEEISQPNNFQIESHQMKQMTPLKNTPIVFMSEEQGDPFEDGRLSETIITQEMRLLQDIKLLSVPKEKTALVTSLGTGVPIISLEALQTLAIAKDRWQILTSRKKACS